MIWGIQSEIQKKAETLADRLELCNSKTFKGISRHNVEVYTIHSFGKGTLGAEYTCTMTNTSRGVLVNCSLGFATRDVYTDPLDMHEDHGFPMWIANISGTPFDFGLSWSEYYSFIINR